MLDFMIFIILVIPVQWIYQASIIPITGLEGLWKHFANNF